MLTALVQATSAPIWFADGQQQAAARTLTTQLQWLAAADLDPRFANVLGRIQHAHDPQSLSALYTEVFILTDAFWREFREIEPGTLRRFEPMVLSPRTGVISQLAGAATSVNGFSAINFSRTAARKNCLARFTSRPTVARASPSANILSRQPSASPQLMESSDRSAPK